MLPRVARLRPQRRGVPVAQLGPGQALGILWPRRQDASRLDEPGPRCQFCTFERALERVDVVEQ